MRRVGEDGREGKEEGEEGFLTHYSVSTAEIKTCSPNLRSTCPHPHLVTARSVECSPLPGKFRIHIYLAVERQTLSSPSENVQ